MKDFNKLCESFLTEGSLRNNLKTLSRRLNTILLLKNTKLKDKNTENEINDKINELFKLLDVYEI
jgi:hypothetical protein